MKLESEINLVVSNLIIAEQTNNLIGAEEMAQQLGAPAIHMRTGVGIPAPTLDGSQMRL